MKLKRVLSIAICLCMLCCLLPAFTSSRADDGVIFFVVNNVVSRPLSKYTMPEVINGEVYVPYSSLSALSTVSYFYDNTLGRLIFYRGDSRITFDVSGSRTFDEQGSFLKYPAIYKNGTVYIPIGIICAKFDIYCTFTDYSTIAPMLRINEGELVGNDLEFTTQLYNLLSDIYDTYISSSTQSPLPSSSPAKVAYLTFSGIPKDAESLLSVLKDIPSTFFLTSKEIEENGSFIRQAVSCGHNVGLLLDANAPIDQFKRANELLRLNLCTTSRTVCIKQGVSSLQSADRIALASQGVRFWDAGVKLDENYQSLFILKSELSGGASAVFSVSSDFGQIAEAIDAMIDKGFVFCKADDWHEPFNNFYSQQ